MKISLITATYNSVNSIEDTINSVKSQDVENLEYIIIDGASTDGTLEIINQHKDVVTKLISEPDNGIYDALNKGIKNATGDIIGFLHSDDYFANNKILNEIQTTFEKRQNDFLYGDLQYITSDNPPKILRYWKSGDFKFSNLKKGWMPPHPTIYFKKNLIDKIGFFDTSYSISADYDWIIRCLTLPEVKVAYIPKVLINMTTGGQSNKSLKNIIKKSREDYKIIRKHRIGGLYALLLKNITKIIQFFKHK
jgi:glycosyltransferase